MIRFGPAGIPLSCKGRTLKDGIEDVNNLSLTALEIQMVRSGVQLLYPEEEEVGCTLDELESMFVVEILRDDEPICDVNEIIEEDDILVSLPSSVTDNFHELTHVGEMAKRLDVVLSMHTPYYMDLSSNTEMSVNCLDTIRYAGIVLNGLDGDMVVTNLGLYNKSVSQEEAENNIYDNVESLMGWWSDVGLKPKLGIEITGHDGVFGSMDQVLDICDQFDGLVPAINFSHLHSRTFGSLIDSSDFEDVLKQVEPYCAGGNIHTTFAGVEHFEGNEKRLTPIKKGDLKFEPLAEALVELKPEATIISNSPLLEHDAVYMRIIHERVLTKKVTKALKLKKKEEELAMTENTELNPNTEEE